MGRRWLATLLAALIALLAGSAPAAAGPLPTEATCTGVWVIVDSSALEGGTSATQCATEFDTGTDALRSAGFEVRRGNGLVCAIDGLPKSCRVTTQAYWSYWQATRTADGGYGPWVYAQLGPDGYQPNQGDAEGWAFGAGEPPGVRPPVGGAAAPPASTPVPGPSATPVPAPGGDPTGLLMTAGVVVVGAIAVGGWWWTSRRRA